MSVEFEVPFVHGLQRHRMTRTGHAYDTERNMADKAMIAALYRDACRLDPAMRPTCAPKRVPVAIEITVSRELPQSRPRRVTSEPDVHKPDVDNVAKLVLDALNGIAYEDDAQVGRLVVQKLPRRRLIEDHVTVTVRRPDWGD